MAINSVTKYVWLLDTIKRYGRITREELNRAWMRSAYGDGKPIQRRTFLNYRNAIERLFNVTITCDPSTYEYYIAGDDERRNSVTDWLLDSTVTNNLITSAHDISDKIFLEEVPSAREYLSAVIDALRENVAVRFDYHPYTRSLPTRSVMIEPYFIRVFRQRWYVVGRHVKEDRIKTYALDRITRLEQTSEKFDVPDDFSPSEYFADAFGIVVDKSSPRKITIKADSTRAKYFRALPLHHSQEEMVTDKYSIFTYRMRITRDLVSELLSYGPEVEVLAPVELRAMMRNELEKALLPYADKAGEKNSLD